MSTMYKVDLFSLHVLITEVDKVTDQSVVYHRFGLRKVERLKTIDHQWCATLREALELVNKRAVERIDALNREIASISNNRDKVFVMWLRSIEDT
jgi:hypothetical protein